MYKGFDRGNRNAHFHLTDPNEKSGVARHYRHMTYTLDLSAFQEGGRIPAFRPNTQSQPCLWHSPADPRHDCVGRAQSILQNQGRHSHNLKAPGPDVQAGRMAFMEALGQAMTSQWGVLYEQQASKRANRSPEALFSDSSGAC